jgi:outer membrane protein W
MKITKTALTIAIAAAMALPTMASAAGKKKTHAVSSSSSQVEARVERDLDSKVARLESELQQLRNQIAATRTEAKSNLNAVVAQTQAKEAAQDAEIAKDEAPKNRLFFRGGYAALTHNVTYQGEVNAAVAGAGIQQQQGVGSGWNVGVGLEHGFTDNFFGLTDALSLGAELGIIYAHYGTLNNMLGTNPSVDQLQITASPKMRVNNLGGFSPWVIPVGLAIGVSGLPSSAVTVLTPGLVLGTGLDYDFNEHLFAGFDFRYQFFGNNLNQNNKNAYAAGLTGMSLDGFQTNANLGFRF